MSASDAQRWNTRYQGDRRFAKYYQPRPFLLENAGVLPERGLALDAAMGLGSNAAFLLERGLHVIGVDISLVAVSQAKARLPGLMAVVADLTQFPLPASYFDLILNFYYLQRSLWQEYRRALRPGGIVVVETLTREMQSIHPEIEPQYLLEPGELRAAFNAWQILAYREGWQAADSQHPRAVASLVARRPPD